MVPEAHAAFGPEGVLKHMAAARREGAPTQAAPARTGLIDASPPPQVAQPFTPGVPQENANAALIVVGVAGIAGLGLLAYFLLRRSG